MVRVPFLVNYAAVGDVMVLVLVVVVVVLFVFFCRRLRDSVSV